MILLSRDYPLENMVATNYNIQKLSFPKEDSVIEKTCICSDDIIVDSNNKTNFQLKTFKKIYTYELDNAKNIVTRKNPLPEPQDNVLSKILAFDYDLSVKDNYNHILNFCNNYGLLFSHAYTWYLVKERTSQTTLYPYIDSYINYPDYMELDKFIYQISKIRTLCNAHNIQYNQKFHPQSKLNDPINILSTLLTLLIPNENILNPTLNYLTAIERLLDIEYLYDLFFRKYAGDYLELIDAEKWGKRYRAQSVIEIIPPLFIHDDIIQRLHNLILTIPLIATEFEITRNCSFGLKKYYYGATKAEEKLHHAQIVQSLEPYTEELMELLNHTVLSILNIELQNIQTYLYYDKENTDTQNPMCCVGYFCHSLYEQIILEIASLYTKDIPLNRCERFDCNRLFFPEGHSDRKYCSAECSNIVARRKYNEKKRSEKPKF